jgi:hypothetical protein
LLHTCLLLQPSEADRYTSSQHAAAEQEYGCYLSRLVASLWALLALLVLAFAVGAGDGPAEGGFQSLLLWSCNKV